MERKAIKTESEATLLPPDALALVMLADGEVQLCVPKWPDDYLIPDRQLALTMLAVKFMNEPEWVAELAEEFGSKRE